MIDNNNENNIYGLTPEIYKALFYTGYTGETMKKENDILMMNNIIRDLGYTGLGDKQSKKNSLNSNTSWISWGNSKQNLQWNWFRRSRN